MYQIEIQDLAANALIELADCGERKVSFKTLNRYGAAVQEVLTEQGKEAVLLLSRDRTNAFVHQYNAYFQLMKTDDEECVVLRDGISADRLRDDFRVFHSMDVISAYVDNRSLNALEI